MAPQREWFEKNYYEVLGVSDKSTPKEVTRAYRKLARQFHPDANPGNAAAEDRFKEISAAYDVVGDEAKRSEYDEVRQQGPMGGMGFGNGGSAGFNPGAGGFTYEGGDLNDIFGGLFGGGGGRRSQQRRAAAPQRGADLEAGLRLSFRDAFNGMETTLSITSDLPCRSCNGSGAANGCAHCHGTGVEKRAREVKVRIPAGVDDGQQIKLAGRGGAGRFGGEVGDLYIRIAVDHDALFGRDGKNLTIIVPVTFAEAVLGTKLTVPTFDGKPVTLKVPGGTPSGKVFRVKGRGVVTKKATGDLLVTVQVDVPTDLNKEQRDALDAVASAFPVTPRQHLGV